MTENTDTQHDRDTAVQKQHCFFNFYSCMFKIQVTSTVAQRRVKGGNKTNRSSTEEKKTKQNTTLPLKTGQRANSFMLLSLTPAVRLLAATFESKANLKQGLNCSLQCCCQREHRDRSSILLDCCVLGLSIPLKSSNIFIKAEGGGEGGGGGGGADGGSGGQQEDRGGSGRE